MNIKVSLTKNSKLLNSVILPVFFLLAGFLITFVIVIVAQNLKQQNQRNNKVSASESSGILEDSPIAVNYNLEPTDINNLVEEDTVGDGEVLSAGNTGSGVAYTYSPQPVCAKKNMDEKACEEEKDKDENEGSFCLRQGDDVTLTMVKITYPRFFFEGLNPAKLTAAEKYYCDNGIIVPAADAPEGKGVTALHCLPSASQIETQMQVTQSLDPVSAAKYNENYARLQNNYEAPTNLNYSLVEGEEAAASNKAEVSNGEFTILATDPNENDNAPTILNKSTAELTNSFNSPISDVTARNTPVSECENYNPQDAYEVETANDPLSIALLTIHEVKAIPLLGRVINANKCIVDPGSSDCAYKLLAGVQVDAPWGGRYKCLKGQCYTLRSDSQLSHLYSPGDDALIVPGLVPRNDDPTVAPLYVSTACKVKITDNTKILKPVTIVDTFCMWDMTPYKAYCERQAAENAPHLNVDCDRWLEISLKEALKRQ